VREVRFPAVSYPKSKLFWVNPANGKTANAKTNPISKLVFIFVFIGHGLFRDLLF
jgi:hypothetical protein